jgi:hypothetical protein
MSTNCLPEKVPFLGLFCTFASFAPVAAHPGRPEQRAAGHKLKLQILHGSFDKDQRDLKGVWPNLSWRSNRQQDKSVVEQIRSTPRTAK